MANTPKHMVSRSLALLPLPRACLCAQYATRSGDYASRVAEIFKVAIEDFINLNAAAIPPDSTTHGPGSWLPAGRQLLICNPRIGVPEGVWVRAWVGVCVGAWVRARARACCGAWPSVLCRCRLCSFLLWHGAGPDCGSDLCAPSRCPASPCCPSPCPLQVGQRQRLHLLKSRHPHPHPSQQSHPRRRRRRRRPRPRSPRPRLRHRHRSRRRPRARCALRPAAPARPATPSCA